MDLAALEAAHDGAHERDTTEEELAEILAAQKRARTKILAARVKAQARTRPPVYPIRHVTREAP